MLNIIYDTQICDLIFKKVYNICVGGETLVYFTFILIPLNYCGFPLCNLAPLPLEIPE